MGEIVFPPEVRQWIESRLGDGYADEADYLIELVRRDMADAVRPETPEEITWIREQVAIGLESGISEQDPFEFLAELRAGRHDAKG